MLKNYIIAQEAKQKSKSMDFYTSSGLHVFFQHEVEGVDVEKVINKVESVIPSHLLSEVEMIIFGWFDEFEERSINAFYNDNALYISYLQDSEEDLYDDIIHEISHSLEGTYGFQIYADDKIKDEFRRKRMHLHDMLWQAGYKVPKSFFMDLEYNQEFDMLLYEKIGYDRLSVMVAGLFINAYAPTSIQEYWATGFTEFYLDSNHNFLSKTSPELYKKILSLQNTNDLDS